ncbi:MAG: GNAT family N-acetyltransferase [Bacillales bacterium]|nr:GNAT family N-acetyltransferase [Bacillales bacterium]
MDSYAFISERLSFRSITVEDTQEIVKWRSDPDIIRYFKNPMPLTTEEHLKWYQNYLLQNCRYDFIIEDKLSFTKIGFLALLNIDKENSGCQISYTIGEDIYRGKGLAKEAVLSLIRFGQDTFNLKNFFAEVHYKNISSIRLVEALGFIKEVDEKEFCIYKYM